MSARTWTWIAIAAAVITAAYVLHARVGYGWVPSTDTYAYFYPKALYVLDSLRDGGRGLLWNPYQSCGGPFFALSETGLLYPPYWLFLVLDPERAFRAVLFVHLVIAGVGAYALARELGARPVAALAGALAFEMGNATLTMTVSMPTHNAPYVLMPVIMLCTERLLSRPARGRALVLGGVLAITFLPGWPQTVLFNYLLVTGRVAWELVTRRAARGAPLLALVVLALVLGPALAAVQFLPELELARASVRHSGMTPREINPYGPFTLELLRRKLAARSVSQPLLLLPCAVSLVALVAGHRRRVALFYALAAAAALGLAFGPGTPLFDLYARLPGAGAFRLPARFLWVTSFCLAPLTALAAEAVAAAEPTVGRRMIPLPAIALAVAGLWALTPGGFTTIEWGVIALVVAVCAAALTRWPVAPLAPAAVLLALVIQLIWAYSAPMAYLLPGAPDYSGAQNVFAELRRRMGPQDRAYLVHGSDLRFIAKSASLFRVPSVLDDELLVSQRFGAYEVMLWTGRPMASVNDVNYGGPLLLRNFSRPLLDLAAARYLVVDPKWMAQIEATVQPFRRVATIDDLTIFENPSGRPRAFYVPRVEVVPDPDALLARLATGSDDFAQVALLESTPASGFTGAPGAAAPATVRFERDDPEHLLLEVDAPAAGFLVLSDQYFPGWKARINGRDVPIYRANYAFRAVEVPGGQSEIEFRYAPMSVALGAAVSAASVLAVAVLSVRSLRHGAQ